MPDPCLGGLCGGTLVICIKPLYDGFIKHTLYAFKAGRNLRKLENATKDLTAQRIGLERQIENDNCRNGLIATDEAKNWLETAEKVESDVQDIRGRCEQRCTIFWCSLPNLWSNYKTSKQATQMLVDVNECKRQKPNNNVTVEPPPPATVHTPVYSVPLPSRVTLLREAIECVKNDPEGVTGIWGPGGVGKTHLLKEMNNSFSGDTFFDYVIFVTASKGCSVEKIQAEITKKLTLREVDGVESQATIIFDFLNRKSFLILLDDIWDQINLLTVGIPYPLGIADQIRRKVVLTTRSKQVCGLMEVRKYINVASLPDDEAWYLFQNKVGQETLSSSPRIEVLAKELVTELKGLPLALITIGWAMHPKTEPVEWQAAIDHMKRSCCDEDDPLSMESVFRRLKFSYDSLKNDTLRQCFLSCSLWPEDTEITMEDLVQSWMGSGLVDEGGIHSSYSKVYGLVCELKAACLLESCEHSSSAYLRRNFRPHRALSFAACAKMHDVVCDMAIWICSGHGENGGKWVVRAGAGVSSFRNTVPWCQAECVSLMWSNMTELPPFGPNNDFSSKLKALYLQGNRLDEWSLGSLQNFTALTYLDLSFNHLGDIPQELCALANLEYLNLSGNDGITEVPVHLGQLTKLRFLSLGGTGVGCIPTEVISSNKMLQVLDLITLGSMPTYNTISIIQVLHTLTGLKAVDIAVRSDDEYGILCKEAKFPIRDLFIQKSIKTPTFCLSGDIFSYDIAPRTLYELTIKDSPMKQMMLGGKAFDALSLLVLSNLHDLKEIKWEGTSAQASFPKLTQLRINNCIKLQHISWVMYFCCLEHLYVYGCHDLEQAFLSTEDCGGVTRYRGQVSARPSVGTFPCLKHLEFWDNWKLASLCDSNVTFPSLETLKFLSCPQLKTLSFTMENLPPKLRKLRMDNDSAWNSLNWVDDIAKASLEPLLTVRNT